MESEPFLSMDVKCSQKRTSSGRCVYKTSLKCDLNERLEANITSENHIGKRCEIPNTIAGGHFMRKRSSSTNSNGTMDTYNRDTTVTQSLLSGQSLVIRRETTTSDDMIVFNDR